MAKEYIKYKDKIRGWIDTREGTPTYISKRNEDHQFHIFGDGFGISVAILNQLRKKEIENIIILFNGQKLRATVQDFFEKGQTYKDGEDGQLILNLSDFVVENMIERQLKLTDIEIQKRMVRARLSKI